LKNIAVLLTCFNRREKTLAALHHLYKAHERVAGHIQLFVYLTDDGSTDGTGEAVQKAYPQIKVLQGTGNLFWAGGMRNSWREAKKGTYDAYLLLNDDTNVFPVLFEELLNTHEYCLKTYGKSGIYIGATQDAISGKHTYGGAVLEDRFMFKYRFLPPTGQPQSCEMGNANIMLVTAPVVEEIGILSEGYVHGVADYDYTLKAVKKDLPVLLAAHYCGTCVHDHSNIYDNFAEKNFSQRLALLKNPLGLDLRSNLNLMRRHFPLRVPFVLFSAGLKLLLPKIYVKSLAKR
tara:strand:+ start:11752 stop:12621 length:870 start_codon:yes stop_codon:yes gene_type:complete